MNHCAEKIIALVEQGRDDRRSILQIGYNLGRLSELTGLGREAFWDRWKGPVEAWDLSALRHLARELPTFPTSPSAQRNADVTPGNRAPPAGGMPSKGDIRPDRPEGESGPD